MTNWTQIYAIPTRGMIGMPWLTNLINNVTYLREDLTEVSVAGTVDVATNWGVSNAAGNWESDTSPQATVTLPLSYVSDVICLAHVKWMDAGVLADSCKFRIYNNTDAVGGDTIGLIGSPVGSSRVSTFVVARFAGLTAVNKTFKLQASRKDGTRTVNVLGRWLMAVGFSVAH